MFLEVALFLETSSVLKTLRYTPGQPPWLAHKWKFRTFTLTLISGSQIFLFKSLFFTHMTPRIFIHRFISFNSNMKKINNKPGRNSHRKTWLLIHNVKKLWLSPSSPSSTDNSLNGQVSFLYFFHAPSIIQIYSLSTKKLQEKVTFSKQYYMSFISAAFISTTG